MRLNKMWMPFLIIGISIIIFSSIGCRVDYDVRANWVYINETSHNITFYPEYYSSFNVKPNDTVIYFQEGDGGKDLTEFDYVSPLHNAYKIFFDDNKCDTLKGGSELYLGDGPTGTANYESKKLGHNFYEFTYRYTEEQYNNAKDCK